MLKNKLNYRLINILLTLAIVYILYLTSPKWGYFVNKIFSVAFPFIAAFAFAYVLNPFVKFLESKGVRKKIAVAVVSMIVALVVIGIVSVTLPLIYDQLILLSKTVINLMSTISNKFDINLGEFSSSITGALNSIISSLGTYLSTGTLDFVNAGVKVLTNVIIIFIVGIYFLGDMDNIREKVKDVLKRKNKREYQYVKMLDNEIGNYFHGLIIFMAIQLVEYSILFRLVNHPNWLLLGILACVTTVIPYFGGYITNIIAVITALTVSTPVFIATLVICLIFPNVDGYLISPRIYGRTNNVNPVMVIFAVAVGSGLFGFIGIVLALPMYILIRATYKYYEKDIKKTISNVKEKIDDAEEKE